MRIKPLVALLFWIREFDDVRRTHSTEELKQNTGKLRRDKDGQNWSGLKWIAFG